MFRTTILVGQLILLHIGDIQIIPLIMLQTLIMLHQNYDSINRVHSLNVLTLFLEASRRFLKRNEVYMLEPFPQKLGKLKIAFVECLLFPLCQYFFIFDV